MSKPEKVEFEMHSPHQPFLCDKIGSFEIAISQDPTEKKSLSFARVNKLLMIYSFCPFSIPIFALKLETEHCKSTGRECLCVL